MSNPILIIKAEVDPLMYLGAQEPTGFKGFLPDNWMVITFYSFCFRDFYLIIKLYFQASGLEVYPKEDGPWWTSGETAGSIERCKTSGSGKAAFVEPFRIKPGTWVESCQLLSSHYMAEEPSTAMAEEAKTKGQFGSVG